MTHRFNLAVSALVLISCVAAFTPSIVCAQNATQFLHDIENIEVTPINLRAIELRDWSDAEKLKFSAGLKQAKKRDLAFLRCEAPDRLNQFGNPEYLDFGESSPDRLPDFDDLFGQRDVNAPDMLRVRAWRGVQGLLHIDGGFGFSSVLQYYLPNQKSDLLREIELAGWKLSGRKVLPERERIFPETMVQIFKRTDQSGPVIRKLQIIEKANIYRSKICKSSRIHSFLHQRSTTKIVLLAT